MLPCWWTMAVQTFALQNTKWTWSLYSKGRIQGHSQSYGQYSLDKPYVFTDLDCCQYPRYLVSHLKKYRSKDERYLFGLWTLKTIVDNNQSTWVNLMQMPMKRTFSLMRPTGTKLLVKPALPKMPPLLLRSIILLDTAICILLSTGHKIKDSMFLMQKRSSHPRFVISAKAVPFVLW